MNKRCVLVFCLILFLIIGYSCSTGVGTIRIASSHFVFPNSNVTPLEETTAKINKLCGVLTIIWGYPMNTGDMNKAMEIAMEKVDANILINAQISGYLTNYGLFSECTTIVRGTGAKMTVGKQDLR